MLTVVDSVQECNKIDRIYHQLLSEKTSKDMSNIDIPSILIRIKPSEVAISKVEVSSSAYHTFKWCGGWLNGMI